MNRHLHPQDLSHSSAVLSSTLRVVQTARSVWIAQTQLSELARDYAETEPETGEQGCSDTHLLLLNAWETPESRLSLVHKKTVSRHQQAMALLIRKGIKQGLDLSQPAQLTRVTPAQMGKLLKGVTGVRDLPEIVSQTREIGRALEALEGGFEALLRSCGGSAPMLVKTLLETFPVLADEALYPGREVRFHTRAQRLALDLMDAHPEVAFHDLEELTALGESSTVEALATRGVLRFTPQLQARLARKDTPAPTESEALEMRSATIWAVELMRRELSQMGQVAPSARSLERFLTKGL